MTTIAGTSVYLLIFSMALVSCVNTRKSVYFNHQRDAVFPDTSSIQPTIIQKNDLLGITVSSSNPQVSAVFNLPAVSYISNTNTYSGSAIPASGYLVNAEGNIELPVLGTLRAAGLTELQLRERIVRALIDRKLLLDPIVSIRHLNYKVTVLGEVAHPQVINIPNEKITLLEALGLAGDITIYGKRDDIMLIREEKGQKIVKRLDLNSSMLLTSPYYYLRANDIIYVEPNKARVASSGRATVWLPTILGGLSFVAIIVDRITR